MSFFREIMQREADYVACAIEGISGLCMILYALCFLVVTSSNTVVGSIMPLIVGSSLGPIHWAILLFIVGVLKLACMFKPNTPRCSVITSWLVSLSCFYCGTTDLLYMRHLDPLIPFAFALGFLNLVVIRHNGRKIQDRARG